MMFTLEEVKKAVGGKLVSTTGSIVFATSIDVSGVSTDTRTLVQGICLSRLRVRISTVMIISKKRSDSAHLR